MPSNLENAFPSVHWRWEEIPFLPAFYIHWFPPGLGISLQSSREVSNFAYSKTLFIQGKSPYITLYCWVQSTAFNAIHVTLTIKTKENGTRMEASTTPCAPWEQPRATHYGALNNWIHYLSSSLPLLTQTWPFWAQQLSGKAQQWI